MVEDGALWRRPAVAGGRLGPRVRLADDVAPIPALTMAVGDLDDDGDSDLVICGDNYQTIWLARGRHRMKRAGDLRFYARRVALADLDGGGRLDLVFGNVFGLEWLRGEPR